MKNFASRSFLWVFDHKIRPTNLLESGPRWSVDGVDWTHTRNTLDSVDYRHSTDVFIGNCGRKRAWTIMVVGEDWWVGQRTNPIRTSPWAHFIAGDRAAALAWFKAQEALPSR